MFKTVFFLFVFVSTLLAINLAHAENIGIYQFDTPAQQQHFQDLTQQFRCLVCQNETLADSNAPLAQDLRFQIYKMLKQDRSDEQIKQFLVDRYGDFVLFRPQFKKTTWLLWTGPFIMLLVALARLGWILRHRLRRQAKTSSYHFSKEDRERIRHLLSEY